MMVLVFMLLLKSNTIFSINGTNSDHLGVSYGIPQGSVLGPLPFYLRKLPTKYVSTANIYFVQLTIYFTKIMSIELKKIKKEMVRCQSMGSTH